jgi:hypothetical protein
VKKILFVMLMLFSLPFAATGAALLPDDFQYCADITGQLKNDSLYQVPLNGHILEKCSAGLQDIRLFDAARKEVPLVVIAEDRPAETSETYPLEITGFSREGSSQIITMKLPEKHRAITLINLTIADRDFKKKARLEGSNDSRKWAILADDVIYDFSSQIDLRKTKLSFSRSDYRWYRLRLVDEQPTGNPQTAIRLKYEGLDFSVNGLQKKELRINSMDARTTSTQERHLVFDEAVLDDIVRSQDKDGNTVIIIKTGLPLDRLRLEVTNPYYFRTVGLYASESGKDDTWQLVTQETIYRFPVFSGQHETKNQIYCPTQKRGHYKIVIENKNSPPLEVKSVIASWVRKNLYFVALSTAGTHSLCFGNPSTTRPDYDLARFLNVNTLSQHAFETLATLQLKENANYKPAMTGGQRAQIEKIILRTVVVLLVIGLGFWLYTLMKKVGKKQ